MADTALAALDGRANAFGARQSASNDVREWKEGTNASRATTYAELLKLSVTKSLPKSWAESFFREVDGDVDAETDPGASPSAPNTGATPVVRPDERSR